MEAAILSGITKEVIASLKTAAINEIAKLVCVKKEIKNLRITFDNIWAQIRGADHIVAQSEATNYRFKQLREYAYEAENIIDLFSIELGKMQESRLQERNASSVCKCCREVGIRYKAANDIQELNKKLERITPTLLQELRREDQTGQNTVAAPQLNEFITIGRNIANECDNLLGLLLQGNQAGQCLFAIVGAVGVGKTTFARKIYQDTRDKFGNRLWVHVSNDSRYLRVWLGERFLGRGETAEQREVLRGYLNDRNSRLLLVIDNMWEENGWNQFLGTDSPRDFCRRGNTVLVTTRHERVARTMGIACCRHIKRLSEDDGWLLLRTTANLRETEATGNIQDVGRRIVQKCSGLPIAVRTIGYHLRGKTREDEWDNVYSDDFVGTYPEIRNQIDASYMKLSYLLKRCFLYCSLYPEGFVIEKQCIMQQWIAEGFFSEAQSQSQEEKAERCYQGLIDRCLLLPEDEAHGVAGAKMLNLFRSFAIYRSQDENYVSDPRNIGGNFKPWRLSVTNGGRVEDIPDDATSLRSLFLFGSQLSERGLGVIYTKLTSLRALDLRDTQVETISSNLERLRQLRYLNLSNTRIRSLPPSIGNLTMLQFLILKNCQFLESLPRRVGRLKKLRSLDISGTPVLNGIQCELLQLTELSCLQGFIPTISAAQNNGHGWKFEELRPLGNLRSLQMLKLDRASVSGDDLGQLNLQEKLHLRDLELWCSSADPQNRNRESEQVVFEALKPAQRLVSLKIANYCGNRFPSWLSNSHLTVLQRLTLDDCLPSRDLPPLGQMMNLKFLAITASDIIPNGGNNNQLRGEPSRDVAFPLLEQLVLGKMESLEPWSVLRETDLPMLRVFHLGGCQRGLISIPSWLQSCRELTSMKIQHAETLQEIANLPSLKELEVDSASMLQTISNICRLEDLKISNCPHLEAVNGVLLLCSVHIELQTAQLPRWLQQQQQQSFKLRRLEITGTEELLNRCSSPFAQFWSIIQDAADHVYEIRNEEARGDSSFMCLQRDCVCPGPGCFSV
ncbi:hypothetical protein E2562_027831 [Oryza meyeriana var. granulata]|uniref:AAA+ ATPase domain-containing protein n=1 Tax=Oryza meyeriana var. granulata TaxID=110450 RepID=A0A6G1DNR2_9ORYZ|nr:hypothetical protein E2562_027831 [Oryza meyeriana var. granulata]